MIVDEVELILEGGHGGAGKVSFGPGRQSGPDGGNGGRGGNLIIKTTTDLTALRPYTTLRHLKAESGKPGDKKLMDGKDAPDLTILVPIGTEITDLEIGEKIELVEPKLELIFCKGGLGGFGNAHFKSSRRTTPKFAQSGLPGEKRHIKISLKFIADLGLIGLPNAGKSSLLNELTNTNVKIADYAFTTLEPNLGVYNDLIIADIPGLIEGAAEGRGLGHKFLKHIEKVKLLLHCISIESEDILIDYQVIRQELEKYSQTLATKKEVILLTKTDLVSEDSIKFKIKLLKKLNIDIYPVSIIDEDSLKQIKKLIESKIN